MCSLDMLKHLHEMSSRRRKSKAIFFDVTLHKEQLFHKVLLFSTVVEQLPVFEFWYLDLNTFPVNNLIGFREHNVSCSMGFCGRSIKS